jgi:hypothetical protein
VGMTCQALDRFETEHGVKFRKITQMPLEGDGTVYQKVEKYAFISCYSILIQLIRYGQSLQAFNIAYRMDG